VKLGDPVVVNGMPCRVNWIRSDGRYYTVQTVRKLRGKYTVYTIQVEEVNT